MSRHSVPWQHRVYIHHIDGNPRNNSVANLRLVHAATSHPLTEAEMSEYMIWAESDMPSDLSDGLPHINRNE
jgi:hypothetical protein